MKKSVRFWASVVSVAIALAGFGWQLHRGYYGQQPWREIFSWHSLRHPWRDLFDLLCIGAFMVIGVNALIDIRRQKHKTNSEAEWYRSLDAIVDIKDCKDADCLYGYLEPVPVEESHAELGWDRRGFDSKPRELARGR